MKAFGGLILFFCFVTAAFGQGQLAVTVDGKNYSNITKAYLGAGGKVILIYKGGGASVDAANLPTDFLESWKISLKKAKAAEAQKSTDDLERAIRSGFFREIDGVVYDTRKAAAGWTKIPSATVIQVLEDGAIMTFNRVPIYVKGISDVVSDTDTISFIAKPVGNYSYINKLNDDRTIRAYDVGKPCDRADIPESVLNGQPFALSTKSRVGSKDVASTLPESGDLQATGSGFFITEDGFLITNFHVVKSGTKFKVRNAQGIYPAKVVQTDKEHDLALLKISGDFQSLSISMDEARLGESVFTIGFPNILLQGTEPKYTDGKISSLSGLKDDPGEYQISVPVQPGNSGGPLVDSTGRVRGVIVAQLNTLAGLRTSGSIPQSVNYAIKSKYIRELVSSVPEVKLNIETSGLESQKVIQAVEQAAAMVLVY